LTREQVADWVDRYERAWRTAGTRGLAELFTDEASYRRSPFKEPQVGLAAIGEVWEAERDGPDEVFEMTSQIVAVEDDTAVVRVEVAYRGRTIRDYRDLWVIRFAPDGRASEFEEWPFWPQQPYA
jgi:SnoaL-like domain